MHKKSSFGQQQENVCSYQNTIITNQLKHLFEKRNAMILKYQLQRNRNAAISSNRTEIISQQSRLVEIEQDSEKIKNVLNELAIQRGFLEEEKISIVIETQDREVRLNFLSSHLIQFYRFTVSDLDLLRLKLIELQGNTAFKKVEPEFTIRKAIIIFLKDHELFKQEYRLGVQLQISLNRKSKDFRWFAIEFLKEFNKIDEKQIIGLINQYSELLKIGEDLIQASKGQVQKDIQRIQHNRDQLAQQVTKQRTTLAQNFEQLKEIAKKISDNIIRTGELESLYDLHQSQRKETQLKLNVLKEQNIFLESTMSCSENIETQLLEIDQAINYFQSKQANFDNQVKSMILINSQSKDFCSPTSTTSLPILSESLIKSRMVKSPNKMPTKQSNKKLIISYNQKSRSKIRSPLSWK